MTLTKAFDPMALIAALKTAGVADAEKLVNDIVPAAFDWLNSSVELEVGANPLFAVAVPVLEALESKATAGLQALEAKVTPPAA